MTEVILRLPSYVALALYSTHSLKKKEKKKILNRIMQPIIRLQLINTC